MSYKELTIWGTLGVTIGLLIYYLTGINSLQTNGNLSQDTMVSYLYKVVITAVILEIIMQSVLAGIKHKEADLGDDERDKLIELKSAKLGHWLTSAIILMCVFLATQIERVSGRMLLPEVSDLYNIMHYLIIGFLISEIITTASKVYFYRRDS
ncbi:MULTISPECIES: hypothetical protein [Pseudoalteromonas]|jgi:hypothetical protein|uniref:Uncharacterized protein n=1 Tax=Pseudoalteromonas lipolytica TaxID=570156 RepID=A0ABY1GCN2_9GAMM|nr:MULTISPECIES: hypothetical protein [Pseudoalteromonas]EWH07424.1 hypothetical protein AT00_06575 [Pseudoalteromonas lipolytica SCSIO 04301]MBE0351149.1 hypothetical protein [Pseudoalteromonas lipolytica LMEB 39]MCC9662579.1 hypothetical protein [Pseudoalteromonas sp. MB41]QMW15743.1 hypothetical protein H3302_06685 [Pseudoalteromonas sp. MT33b]QPL44124.1 hypothetical protein IT970_06850 [Pseudoalteromonas sp. A41-2]|tara:strand:+ start:3832 stop:4290 length:459 start_codon:yes stop_codon:yes gene_type:complete